MASSVGASAQAPSQFAKLLHRSKFSSYDPKIAQVYTSHGGYRHRGDFGLKRPLPASARGPRTAVFINAVDSKYKHTDWNYGTKQSSFVKAFDELGVGVVSADLSTGAPLWLERLGTRSSREHQQAAINRWQIDTTFDASRASEQMLLDAPKMQPNLDAMNHKQFKKHVSGRYRQHHDFLQYCADKDVAARRIPMAMGKAALSETNGERYHQYLEFKATQQSQGSSTQLSPFPHPSAALSYQRPNAVQQMLRFPPTRGRVMQNVPGPRMEPARRVKNVVAAVGGVVARIPSNDQVSDARDALDLVAVKLGEQATTAGEADLRVTAVSLYNAPEVVGTKERSGTVAIDVMATRSDNITTSNPDDIKALPGSPAYTIYSVPGKGSSATPQLYTRPMGETPAKTQETHKVDAQALLERMLGIMEPGEGQL